MDILASILCWVICGAGLAPRRVRRAFWKPVANINQPKMLAGSRHNLNHLTNKMFPTKYSSAPVLGSHDGMIING